MKECPLCTLYYDAKWNKCPECHPFEAKIQGVDQEADKEPLNANTKNDLPF